jgi:hypothetical protein
MLAEFWTGHRISAHLQPLTRLDATICRRAIATQLYHMYALPVREFIYWSIWAQGRSVHPCSGCVDDNNNNNNNGRRDAPSIAIRHGGRKSQERPLIPCYELEMTPRWGPIGLRMPRLKARLGRGRRCGRRSPIGRRSFLGVGILRRQDVCPLRTVLLARMGAARLSG